MILTATPYRVSLFGGGTDYPEWFEENGGAVLGMAINHYCYIAAKPLPLLYGDVRYRVVYSRVEDRKAISEIEHPAVRGVLTHLGWDRPLELVHMGDLPARTGLGSSSAFTVGLLNALRTLSDTRRGFYLLAEEAIHVERDVIGEAVGCQDQIFAAFGGLNFIRFARDGWSVESLSDRLSEGRLRELEDSLVLVYTGHTRNAHEMAAEQLEEQRRNQGATVEGAFCTPRFALGLMEQQAHDARELLLDEGRPLAELGPMLHAAWRLKRGLSNGLTLVEIDALYEHGLRCGATGGKLLGAGGGGFVLFYAPDVAEFEARIEVPCVRFRVAHLGTFSAAPKPGGV